MPGGSRSLFAVAAIVVLGSLLAGCVRSASGADSGKLLVATSVSPITDIAKNVAGNAATVVGLIPEGVDSHTFEPTPDTARTLADADLIVLNGLDLEDPTLRLAEANHQDGAEIYLLGPHTVSAAAVIYDFSFPRSEGHPNPHLWMDVPYAIQYAQLICDQLVKMDPSNAATYKRNAAAYEKTLQHLDAAVQETIDTIPPQNRVLLTYHDSFAYFAHDYGMRVIGAIQPSDFAEPSAQDVGRASSTRSGQRTFRPSSARRCSRARCSRRSRARPARSTRRASETTIFPATPGHRTTPTSG